jgi:hypothetical protein
MSIQRRKTVDLSNFDSLWTGSNITLGISGIGDLIKYQKKLSKIQRENLKKERELARVRVEIETFIGKGLAPTKELSEQEEALEEVTMDASLRVMEEIQKFVREKFISGNIYDSELKAHREMSKKDVLEFDQEVLRHIVAELMGGSDLKAN